MVKRLLIHGARERDKWMDGWEAGESKTFSPSWPFASGEVVPPLPTLPTPFLGASLLSICIFSGTLDDLSMSRGLKRAVVLLGV